MARTTARAAVMQMIFEHMAGGEGGEETLQMVYEALRKEGLPGVDSISENEPSESDRAYITEVLDGVLAHLDELDEAIQAASPRWEISRMPHVDLTILRMAAWEILYEEGIPGPVAINEATSPTASPSRRAAASSTAYWVRFCAESRRKTREARRCRA